MLSDLLNLDALNLDAWTLFLAVVAAATIGLSKGGLQIASMFAVPVLAIALPPLVAAATLLPVLIAADVVSVVAYRKYADWRLLKVLLPGMLAGVGVGWLTASWVPVPWIMFTIGAIGLFYCVRTVLAPARTASSTRAGLFWSLVSGFTSFISHSGGAPYQIFMASQPILKLAYAGTTALAFATVNLVKIYPYWRLGAFESGLWQLSLLLIPVGALFTAIGIGLLKIVSEATFRRVLDVALFAISAKLMFDGIAAAL
ncbi:sulfite exporter TauE/SafE family protein [Ancylobacter sp. G4_0304]|uniref:sulfite exporter TauE/SafE family protein n=1 Tax=Ancylobacter sp. G4_0304 TaxID=3114289 RepID=UPI0039C61A67